MRTHALYLSTICLGLLATIGLAQQGGKPEEDPREKLLGLREVRLSASVALEQRVEDAYDRGLATMAERLHAAELRFEAEFEMSDHDGRVELCRKAVERARTLERHAKGLEQAGASPIPYSLAKLHRLELEIELQKLLIEQQENK